MTPLEYYLFLRGRCMGYSHYAAVVSALMNYCKDREELCYYLKSLRYGMGTRYREIVNV